METIRQDVLAFVRATERLLSPITLDQELNQDERDMVAISIMSMMEKYPASYSTPGLFH
jgi:hypothetical protein